MPPTGDVALAVQETTVLNAATARSLENAKSPIVVENDRECLRLALATIPQRPEGPRVVYLRDTLELGRAYVSDACLGALQLRDVHIGAAAPLRWSGDDIVSPFDAA